MELLVNLFIALALVGVTGSAVLMWVLHRRATLGLWREVADHARMADVRVLGFAFPLRLVGRAGRHPVQFCDSTGTLSRQIDVRPTMFGSSKERKPQGTYITIGCASDLTLRREDGNTTFDKLLGRREIEIGDEAFDREVYVLGTPEVARAVLDAATRDVVREMLGGRIRDRGSRIAGIEATVTIVRGTLVADVENVDAAYLGAALDGLLEMAARLTPPDDVAQRIADNTATEPEWGVRLENVLLLSGAHPRHPATAQALRAACEDERQEVQLRAAQALGGELGNDTLVQIATREWADDRCAAEAVATLGKRLPLDRTLTVLAHALRTRRIETAKACMDSIGHRGGIRGVETLSKVMAVEMGPLAVAAAKSLGASGEPTAEAPLVRALGAGSDDLRVAAAEALGRVGSATAVLPLKETAAAHRLAGGLQRAARQSVAMLQSRLQGASPGQLSVVEAEGGRLSLVDEDSRGRVSIAAPANRSERR